MGVCEKMSLSDRLKTKRLSMGFTTQINLAKACNLKPQIIQRLESGENKNSKHLKTIAATLKTTVDYLLTGDGGVISSSSGLMSITPSAVQQIPMLNWNGVALWSETLTENTMSRTTYKMVTTLKKCSKKSFALQIKDDSMVSLYPNSISFLKDDVIIIDPEKPVKDGAFVVAQFSNSPEAIFRELVDISGILFLKPLNPTFDMQKLTDDVKIYGVLSSSFREYS